MFTLETPVYPRNVDGTLNKQGPICQAAILQMEMGENHKESTEMAITNTGNHDILLGTDWLKAYNPSIDWAKNKLHFDRYPLSCFPDKIYTTPTLGQLLPSEEWEEQYGDYIQSKYQGIDASQRIMAHLQRCEPVVAWTTVSTNLAKAEQPKTTEIPPEFCQYRKVFSDEEAQWLPKHQPWYHKIDLIPGMEMRKTTIYHLTPVEKVALKEYIEDSLKRGTLWQSEAPHACSFFFIDKKDGKLWPVQDYRPLNAITVKNAAPIPLTVSQNSLTNFWEHDFLPN